MVEKGPVLEKSLVTGKISHTSDLSSDLLNTKMLGQPVALSLIPACLLFLKWINYMQIIGKIGDIV